MNERLPAKCVINQHLNKNKTHEKTPFFLPNRLCHPALVRAVLFGDSSCSAHRWYGGGFYPFFGRLGVYPGLSLHQKPSAVGVWGCPKKLCPSFVFLIRISTFAATNG